ncbi:MAG: RNA-binding protein [Nannocystaceae bacterium]|nr:RNA-binding protein [Deltaproteobacteria bacterium]MBP7292407.1 RNA-binding protein [Nannocystaceae bacterium]
MSKKLFVGGLSWGTTDDRLKEAFGRFGEVTEAKIITDRETGRSRGFGFVTYAEPAAAEQAIKELDGQELDGRTIRVNEAQNQTRPRGGGGPRDGGPPRSFGGNDRGPRGGAPAGDRDRGGGGPGRDRDRDRDRGRDFGDFGDDGGGRRGRGARR